MLLFLARFHKRLAWFMLLLFYCDLLIVPVMASAATTPLPARPLYMGPYFPSAKGSHLVTPVAPAVNALPAVKPVENRRQPVQNFTTGPTQPEMQQFSSVNSSNMVDLFSGDFSYNIPLMDVGGYPITLGYRGGISMDQEASWVGLGWNINPGTISRNLRGLPDDFHGTTDSIKKIQSIRENKTIGVTGGLDVEIVGVPKDQKGSKAPDTNATAKSLGTIGGSLGVFHNNYKGWGLEHGLNASINSAIGSMGGFTAGLSLSNSTQEGLSLSPSISVMFKEKEPLESGSWMGSSYAIGSTYNTRGGLKGLQLTTGVRQYYKDVVNQKQSDAGTSFSSFISFASPSYTPSITMPFTSTQFSFTAKVGWAHKVLHPSAYLSGYVSKQRIAKRDTLLALPSYGYLNFQDGARNRAALLDFNREKEIPYREKPAVAHIAIPAYTYDAFSITGEGTGGMFRAYRGDIGFVYDHHIRSKDESDRLSVDVGLGDMVHGGIDLNINRAFTQNGPWLNDNPMANLIDFRRDSAAYEAVYFRNPGEKSINSKKFYETLGGDDVVAVGLYQSGRGSLIQTTNELVRYKGKAKNGVSHLTTQNVYKDERDKRTQVISYLTAREAETGGLSKYIDNYRYNMFNPAICGNADFDKIEGSGTGLPGFYFNNKFMTGEPFHSQVDATIYFDWQKAPLKVDGKDPVDDFSIRWIGRIYAPVTGSYSFYTESDDGVILKINDTTLIDIWNTLGKITSRTINLVAGQFYKIELRFRDTQKHANVKLYWTRPDRAREIIPMSVLYGPGRDTFDIKDPMTETTYLTKEKRINSYRKENHISEITVLNNDGRRYVYGLPVYNLKQKEATFAVNANGGNQKRGLVKYTHGKDNSTDNEQGKDHYYSSEEVPAYAHSFLLTGILSADYSDITGNGISSDDIGDAVKFNYTKICGIGNPFQWRAPAVNDSVTYNEGLKTDYRDDKGSYVYGEKELWYMHSIESKTMLATFVLEPREDVSAVDERGYKINYHAAQRLKEINLYSKADFMKNGTHARPIKTVHFKYSYELCPGINNSNSGKLTLKEVWFTYNGSKKGKENPYVFSYKGKNPGYHTQSYDRWGNYKDPLQNPGSTTSNVITNAEYPYALQDSALAAQNAAAWTLDSIHLPSGGALKVEYESDDYAYVQNKRAMQLFKLAGLGNSPVLIPGTFNRLYTDHNDHLYVFVKVPYPVSNVKELYTRYLQDVKKLYFKLYVRMPDDQYGSGYEYVTCYADLDQGNSYGLVNANTIWLKMGGISLKGEGGGSYSPLAKAAIQFLRLNLPSKAYPGSETGDNVDLAEGVKMLASLADNIKNSFRSFDAIARAKRWAVSIDTARSFVRLNNPNFKKYGGGQRVKRVIVYDNWDKMTNQRPALYGQEYIYTTKKEIDGVQQTISSGVASYEPGLGGEENPFRVPIEYVEKIAPLGPVTLGYTEEPLGESYFPAASVGYSRVRTRTIHYKNKKSANGYDETEFYTAYDFPTYTDRTLIDGDTKKRYKPDLANFLRINAKHYLTLSQGFKIELNDMHGKVRRKASYAETDPNSAITYSLYVYKVENNDAEFKRLSNTVMVMKPDGTIDSAALIGKDVELMVDMREQLSITNAYNVNLNTEMFTVPFLPGFWLLPSMLNLAQREENRFRTVATVKVIQRYGIIDSVIQVDKGSQVSTKDLLYDSETGDVLVTRTMNEFRDYVYNVNYPSHWAYDGMGLAYKNIGVTLNNVTIQKGKLVSGISETELNKLLSSGDEIIVAGKQKTGDSLPCIDQISTFPVYNKIWAIDSSVAFGGSKVFFFVDRAGRPYDGADMTFKVIRSGRRNMFGSVGSVTCLKNPLVKNGNGQYELVINDSSRIIAASAGEFRQLWKTEDILARDNTSTCIPIWRPTGNVQCVQSGGVNTGYQQAEEVDTNPKSSSYNTTRWVYRLNCVQCPRPAQWISTDSIRCAVDDNGNYTGFQEREETDTAQCSATSGRSRWIGLAENCAACPKPGRWVPTDSVRCVLDSLGQYTGYQERMEIDSATCTGTTYTTRWVNFRRNCEACASPAKWVAIGQAYCDTLANGDKTGRLLQKFVDTAWCSATYNSVKYDTTLNCSVCATPAKWINTGSPVCELIGGVNTGYLLQQQTDTAICSPTYNTTRTVSEKRCDVCPTPSKWVVEEEYCRQNVHGDTTGFLIRVMRDTASCSPSFNTTKIDSAWRCDVCQTKPKWNIEQEFCRQNVNGDTTGYLVRVMRDTASCSPSFNTTKTDSTWRCDICRMKPKWIIETTYCEQDSTGKQIRVWKDTAICSSTYNNTYTDTIENCAICPKPQNWQPTGEWDCERTGDPHFPGGYTGYQEYEVENVEPCSFNYGYKEWRRGNYSPDTCKSCGKCYGINTKCIGLVCETATWTCISSTRRPNGLYRNCFAYMYTDGSISGDIDCREEPFSCNIVSGPSEPALQSNTKSANTSNGINRVETKDDLFYKSILPREKYELYRQRQQVLNEMKTSSVSFNQTNNQ